MSVLGGYSDEMAADEKIKEMTCKVKAEAEKQAGRTFSQFTAVKYRKQIVNGTNYLIKVHVGEQDYAHLLVFEGLHQEAELRKIKLKRPFTIDDPIESFKTDRE